MTDHSTCWSHGYSSGWARGMRDAASELDAYASGCGSNLSTSIREVASKLRRIADGHEGREP